MTLRRRFIEQQQEVVRAMRAQEFTSSEWTPDDAIRFHSFLFAVFRALDKASLPGSVLRVCEHGCMLSRTLSYANTWCACKL